MLVAQSSIASSRPRSVSAWRVHAWRRTVVGCAIAWACQKKKTDRRFPASFGRTRPTKAPQKMVAWPPRSTDGWSAIALSIRHFS